MFAEIFQRQKNKVKKCGLKTVNEVRASNFLAGGRSEFLATPLCYMLINNQPIVSYKRDICKFNIVELYSLKHVQTVKYLE